MTDSVLTSEELRLRSIIQEKSTIENSLRERIAELITEQAEGNKTVNELENKIEDLEQLLLNKNVDLKESQHEALDRMMKIGVLSAERDIWRNNCFTLQAQNVTNEAQKRSGIAQNASPTIQKGFKDGE